MEKLDVRMQRDVWRRVYGKEQGISPQTRQKLLHCHRRALENAKVYESLAGHSRYGEAFHHMAQQSKEHGAMIQQMLGK